MALLYCEVCGVLIAKPPAEGPRRTDQGTICDRCFGSRKVIIAEGESSDLTGSSGSAAPARAPAPAAPSDAERVQFPCPTCRSLLQLKPVPKRSRIRCPKCSADFYLMPDGRLEGPDGAPIARPQAPPPKVAPPVSLTPVPPPPPAAAAAPSAQQKLLDDLKPVKQLDFLDKVPEKKASPLPSVLDSGQYDEFANKGSGSDMAIGRPELAPVGTGPGQVEEKLKAEKGAAWAGESYRILDSGEGPVPKEAPPAKPTTKRIAAADPRRKPDPADEKRRAELARKAREAEAATQRYVRQNTAQAFRSMGYVALVALPLLIAAPILISADRGTGFAARDDGLGVALRDLGRVVRRGISQWNDILSLPSLDD